MTRTVNGKNVTLKPDDGCLIADKRNEREYDVVCCSLKNEKYFFEKAIDTEEETE